MFFANPNLHLSQNAVLVLYPESSLWSTLRVKRVAPTEESFTSKNDKPDNPTRGCTASAKIIKTMNRHTYALYANIRCLAFSWAPWEAGVGGDHLDLAGINRGTSGFWAACESHRLRKKSLSFSGSCLMPGSPLLTEKLPHVPFASEKVSYSADCKKTDQKKEGEALNWWVFFFVNLHHILWGD